jgi:4-hydroxy-3-methylbut-2-enyl diphosphate reductase IspH
VQTAADLREEWFDNVEKVGITAGTSTPEETIFQVEQRIIALTESHVPTAVETQSVYANLI